MPETGIFTNQIKRFRRHAALDVYEPTTTEGMVRLRDDHRRLPVQYLLAEDQGLSRVENSSCPDE